MPPSSKLRSSSAVDPLEVESCGRYITTTAMEFEEDPRPALADHETDDGDVFHCWAKELSDDHWAAVVAQDYELDDDVLEALENYGFEPCD